MVQYSFGPRWPFEFCRHWPEHVLWSVRWQLRHNYFRSTFHCWVYVIGRIYRIFYNISGTFGNIRRCWLYFWTSHWQCTFRVRRIHCAKFYDGLIDGIDWNCICLLHNFDEQKTTKGGQSNSFGIFLEGILNAVKEKYPKGKFNFGSIFGTNRFLFLASTLFNRWFGKSIHWWFWRIRRRGFIRRFVKNSHNWKRKLPRKGKKEKGIRF